MSQGARVLREAEIREDQHVDVALGDPENAKEVAAPAYDPCMAQDMIRVGTLLELQDHGPKVVRGADRSIVVFVDDGKVAAVDNRCPHMGFPLQRGTVKDGILTCHWHEARFDLCSGCTFDAFADDVPTFDTVIQGDIVYVCPTPRKAEDASYHLGRLEKGILEGVGLVQAKSIIGLLKSGSDSRQVVRKVVLLASGRRDTWAPGMAYLTIIGRLMPYLSEETAYFALCSAVQRVASEMQQTPPRRPRQALDGPHDKERLHGWMRHWLEGRHRDGAERVLLTAIADQASPAELSALLLGAETDRVYAAQGHTFDGANKALELMELVGADLAADLLPLALPAMAAARGSAEDARWHHPHELIAPLLEAEARLPEALNDGRDKQWKDDGQFSAALLGEDPFRVIQLVEDSLRAGAPPAELSKLVAHAAAMRLARFALSNDVNDWFNPQHTFIYANAVDQVIGRTATPLTVRAILHAALAVYMDRFLNVPPARLPGERTELDDLPADPKTLRDNLLAVMDQRAEVDAAARLVARYLRLGHPLPPLVDTLVFATVREDLDFHTMQVLEAGVNQCRHWQGRPEAECILIGVVRQLAAACPTRRSGLQTATIALRLHRGEKVYEEQ